MSETYEFRAGFNLGLTQTEIDNLTPSEGDVVYNKTTSKLQVYYNNQWNNKN